MSAPKDGGAAKCPTCRRSTDDRYLKWLIGGDTGISSETIWSVMTGLPTAGATQWHRWTPGDPSDFGRCHRLLQRFPEWRGRLAEVADQYPHWRPMVERWAEMEVLYEEERPTGSAPKLFALMCELEKKGHAAARQRTEGDR